MVQTDDDRVDGMPADEPVSPGMESAELETLLRVSSTLTSSLDLPTVLQAAIDSAVMTLGIQTGAIYTLESDSLFLGATTPELPSDFPMALRFAHLADHPHLQRCLRDNEIVYLEDARTADLSTEERLAVEARGLVTVLYVPLVVDSEPRGALILGTHDESCRFSHTQMRLARTLAHQISLAVANSQLYQTVSTKNLELELAHHEMTAYAERLSAMTANLATAERRERRRLAEELHDRVSQSLAVAKMTLGRALTEDCNDHQRELYTAGSLIDEALLQTRAITEELSPAVLLQPGLSPALRAQAEHVKSLYGLDVALELVGCDTDVNDDVKVFVYRVAHELLLNVVKHAHASCARLEAEQEGGLLTLRVIDEGDGMGTGTPTGSEAGGFGLLSIREQLAHLGGTLDIERTNGQGTTVVVRLPL